MSARLREIRERHDREGAATEVRYLYAWEQAHLDRAWLLARVEELEAALRPFAEAEPRPAWAGSSVTDPPVRLEVEGLGMGDFKAARRALARLEEP